MFYYSSINMLHFLYTRQNRMLKYDKNDKSNYNLFLCYILSDDLYLL
eukprot:UN27481